MARYIDADNLMEQLRRKKCEIAQQRYIEGFNDALMKFRSMIHSAKTVDVAEVKHGKWDEADTERGVYIRCSKCHFDGLGAGSSYCPCCGAKMDGE